MSLIQLFPIVVKAYEGNVFYKFHTSFYSKNIKIPVPRMHLRIKDEKSTQAQSEAIYLS